jgi:hypothetical protein
MIFDFDNEANESKARKSRKAKAQDGVEAK